MDPASVRAIERPHKSLMTLYLLQALATLVAFPFVIVPLWFRYHTLRYRIDDEGISASWGILFRREVYVTYRRIQDIHVSRNLFERWLGIGKVEVQTASGSSSAEMTFEGMTEYDALRDYLYARMRGVAPEAGAASPAPAGGNGVPADEAVALLREIRDDVNGVRRALEAPGRA
jgi:membrane protein YdbS with pleckstrin-like domain